MECSFFYDTIIGRILISNDDVGITKVQIVNKDYNANINNIILFETDLIKATACQLMEYLSGGRRKFTIPLNFRGTMFQNKVWKALCNIPYGETRSYKQVANEVGNPLAYRAVGMANHKNPIMCIVPCHRVIGSNGSLTGYAAGLDVKQQLLKLENYYREEIDYEK